MPGMGGQYHRNIQQVYVTGQVIQNHPDLIGKNPPAFRGSLNHQHQKLSNQAHPNLNLKWHSGSQQGNTSAESFA